ncbi:MAG: hypothetical protein JNK65_04025, partial [Deltaproteobacteria bacterium]|nr:hypothetical protein [Deltaproteobacteria bacterium]
MFYSFFKKGLFLFLLLLSFIPNIVLADADDVPSGALVIGVGFTGNNSLSTTDTVDWWKVNITNSIGKDIKVFLDVPAGQNYNLELYSSTNQSTPLQGSYNSTGANETIQIPITYSGFYYMKVIRAAGSVGTGFYSITPTVVTGSGGGGGIDKAGFGGETIPDGTSFAPNEPFTKTWTIRNTGTSTWNSNYYLRYVKTNFSGKLSVSQGIVPISGTVAPNASYTFSISMKAPGFMGSNLREDWEFVGPKGVIKVDLSSTVWASINVNRKADIVPFKKQGWASTIVMSSSKGAISDSALYQCQVNYANFNIRNTGDGGAFGTFYNHVYIDGSYKGQWTTTNLNQTATSSLLDFPLNAGSLSVGNHTIEIRADATGIILESDDVNNNYSRSFTISSCSSPVALITSPSNNFNAPNSTVTLSGSCQDTDGNLSQAIFRNESTGWNSTQSISGNNWSGSRSISLQTGSNILSLTCNDDAGGTNKKTILVTYGVCPNGTPKDPYNDPCNHDEDGDGILDVNDACPSYPNDGIGDPCNPNDNGGLTVDGSSVVAEVISGGNSQVQVIKITNKGGQSATYTIKPNGQVNWIAGIKNGGETDAL